MSKRQRGGDHFCGTNHPCPVGIAVRLPHADWPQNQTTSHTHTSTRPLPNHRQPGLSHRRIAQGPGEETFCLQQDGIGQGVASGTSDLKPYHCAVWQFQLEEVRQPENGF